MKSRFVFYFTFLLMSSLLLFSGCNVPFCRTNQDCTRGLVCHRDYCAACKTSTECDSGYSCFQGKCVLPCSSDNMCQVGEVCSEKSFCVPSGVKKRFEVSECSDGELRRCFDANRAMLGVGVCGQGLQTCKKGAWGRCQGQILPSKEICDGKDNDCDGKVDNGVCFSAPTCLQVPCRNGRVCNKITGKCETKSIPPCSRCAVGHRCDKKTGTCNEKCETDGDCILPYFCGDGLICRPIACSESVPCPKGEKCNHESICVRLPGCVTKNTCNKDQRCNEKTGRCEKRCSAQSCLFGQVCDQNDGKCKVVSNTFDVCGVNNRVCDPKAEQVCAYFDSSAKNRFCFEACTGKNDKGCRGNCVKTTSERFICIPFGTKREGESCGGQDPHAGYYDDSLNCSQGNFCIRSSPGKKGICTKQ